MDSQELVGFCGTTDNTLSMAAYEHAVLLCTHAQTLSWTRIQSITFHISSSLCELKVLKNNKCHTLIFPLGTTPSNKQAIASRGSYDNAETLG